MKSQWLLSSLIIASFIWEVKAIDDKHSFFFNSQFEKMDQCLGINKNITSSSLAESGVLMTVPEGSLTLLQNVTICFRAGLTSGTPSCLFDVAGIQFFYSSPMEPQYGHIRFTGSNHYRTVLFKPHRQFLPKAIFSVCLSLRLIEDLEEKVQSSSIELFWNGVLIVNETMYGESAIKGPLLLDQKNFLGVCNLSAASERQLHLEQGRMSGWILDFKLWPRVISNETLLAYTGCSPSLKQLQIQNMMESPLLTHNGFEDNLSQHIIKIRFWDYCEYPNFETPMHFKIMSNNETLRG